MNNTEKNIFNELLERGKQSGTLSTKEIYNVIDEADVDLDKLSEFLDQNNIKVDDDFNVCDSVSKMLKNIGMRAEWTTSGKEAAYRAKMAFEEGDSYHTFIIDWQMPEPNGIETARKIRGVVGEDAPIIILTAYDWTDIE